LNALFLDGNTVCSNSFDSVSCGCKSGFSGNSFSCSDVNECFLNSHNCHANASCINTVGSFNCSCKSGFSGYGYECSDIDECALNTHGCISSDCRNTLGSFFCIRGNAISALYHTCALTTSGAAKCWGRGANGQLGNGATGDSNTPVDVSGMSSGVIAISAGGHHTCALTTSGAAKCWGKGANGQLGNGATGDSNTPVDVSGMSSGVVAISAGAYHTCALTTSGAAKCWGFGANGQLGNGATGDSNTPVGVSGMSSGVIAIAGVDEHTCALTTSGAAKCWGLGTNGQLGNGATGDSNTPVDVSGMSSGVIAISAGGDHTCALTTSGAAKCWGLGANGQLGNGATGDSNTPVDVSGMSSGVVAISAGAFYTCALTTSGAAKCWGLGANGQLGNGATGDSNTPVIVTNF
jgi:alpha-tubulin suppressor-like RCC1 family protein